MKQKLDEVRTLAIKLYEAGQATKRKQPKEIWGSDRDRAWCDLPSESVAVWDAVAILAYKQVPLYKREDCVRALRRIKLLVTDKLEEVTNNIGGVVGYKLSLSAAETEQLLQLLKP